MKIERTDQNIRTGQSWLVGYRESTEINKRKDIVCLLGMFYSNKTLKLNIQNNDFMRSKINVPLKMIERTFIFAIVKLPKISRGLIFANRGC